MVTFAEIHSSGCAAKVDGGIEIVSRTAVLHVRISENPDAAVYEAVALAIDHQASQHRRICIIIELDGGDGEEAIALWQDDSSNFRVRRFPSASIDKAKAWLARFVP